MHSQTGQSIWFRKEAMASSRNKWEIKNGTIKLKWISPLKYQPRENDLKAMEDGLSVNSDQPHC